MLSTHGLDRYNGSCNTIDDLSSRTCIPNKMENVDTNVQKKK